jgi:serine/threonine-protein kinase
LVSWCFVRRNSPTHRQPSRTPAQHALRALGLLTYAGALAAVFAISGYSAFSLFVRRGVTTVPEVAGLPEEHAHALLADQGLRLKRIEPGRYSATVPAGRAVDSRPRPGSLVKRGAAVEVAFSLGAQRLTVPNLAGRALQAAQVTLSGQGLALGDTLAVVAAETAPGAVVGQDPAPGTEVPVGSRVDLLVALDASPETYVMPDLVYRRYEPVRRSFEAGGFRMGSVKFEPYEGIAEGTILRQLPLPGHPLRRRDAISLVVVGAGAPSSGRPS